MTNEEPPPKHLTTHEVSAAIDKLETYSLLLTIIISLLTNSGIEKLCNIIDRDRMVAECQGLMTDYFSNQSCE